MAGNHLAAEPPPPTGWFAGRVEEGRNDAVISLCSELTSGSDPI